MIPPFLRDEKAFQRSVGRRFFSDGSDEAAEVSDKSNDIINKFLFPNSCFYTCQFYVS